MSRQFFLKTGVWLKSCILRRLRWLAVAVPAAGLVLQLPVRWWIWDLAQHFHLYWMAAAGAMLLVCLGFRWWWRAGANLLLLLILAHPLREYYLAEPDTASPGPGTPPSVRHGGSEFRFLSYNLLVVGRQAELTRQALEAANPDMLLLLEFTPAWQKALQPVLDRYPHKTGLPQNDSFGIWFGSRLPLESCRLVVVGDGPFPTVVAHARISGIPVTIVGAHPMNPVFPSWSAIWRDQYQAYPEYLKETNADALIFAGDLNSSPFSTTFRDFLSKTGLRDSARGRGLMNTWSGPRLPIELGLPIDHILVGGSIKVLDLQRGPQLGSDHRWLEAKLLVEPGAPHP